MNDDTTKTQYYINKDGAWIPVQDGNAVRDHLTEEAIAEEEESQTEYLDQLFEDMAKASVSFQDFTLNYDEAGMVSDYIDELQMRATPVDSILHIPAKLLHAVVGAAEQFVYYFGDGENFNDDAIQAYDTLQYTLKRYKEEVAKEQD